MMIREKQKYLFPEMEKEAPVIYESPDGGKTVYASKEGEFERVEVTELPNKDTHGYYKHA